MESAFHDSVDDYIDWCKEEGVEPEKPYSGKFVLRFSPELHQKAVFGAAELGLSLNGFVEKSVRDELAALHV